MASPQLLLLLMAGLTALIPDGHPMPVDQDATCSYLDRHQYLEPGSSDPMVEEEFRGHITVIYSVAPPKPFLTRRIYSERDPIYYNKILYDEQIQLFHNLFNRFESNDYRNVQFMLGAAPSRHPEETNFDDFDDFLDNVTSIAASYNISVYPNPLNENGTFAMFGLKEFQVYVLDQCSRITYIIEPPWSLIQYSYVKAAVLSTLYDRPCGPCDFDNFLNATLPEKHFEELQLSAATETVAKPTIHLVSLQTATTTGKPSLAASDLKPYDDSTESEEPSTEEDADPDGTTEEVNLLRSNITEVNGTDSSEEDIFANLTVAGPELALPLKIIIPAVHIRFDHPKANSTYDKYTYVVFQSDKPNDHQHENEPRDGRDASSLREISLRNASANHSLCVVGVEWPLAQLHEILNTSSVFYNDQTSQVYRKLARYNASGIDELEELSVSSQYAVWKRRQADQIEQTKASKRHFIRKHYERLIQWLSWQFDKS
ncbi:uncharacterized protein LOC129770256 isoform X2 [Toxorhynchites rutilus septentrionalis]|uniref:uncharacterized protein LOC129770256 isoform X2 n=1 Tax=Toxorhynchites rutilus septentrionalis TaxID=329112 RepID=UPI002478A90E|nr:uncharacterized protein LOC129770256 isoform X2 [Toxorhynchites rutilus septentrionalis]